MPEPQTLLYLVYGSDQKYQQELSYSVLSAIRAAGGSMESLRILLFCDAENQRPDLPVESYVMSAQERDSWTFGGSYNHALKIFALRKGLELSGGKVCFVDTDTAFLQTPQLLFDRITPQRAVLHHNEGLLSQRERWSALLQEGWGKLLNAAEGTDLADLVHPAAPMFNSGLIGVAVSMGEALERAAVLARDLYRIEPVFNIEQFAVGAALGQDHEVVPGQDIVDHYCGYRRFVFHRQIPGALAALQGDYAASAATRLPVITDPPKPLLAKIRARVHARWHQRGDTYRFAYLAYLSGCAAGPGTQRQIWADIALDMLRWTRDRELARRSFRQFSPDGLPHSGLDAGQQAAWHAYWQGDDNFH